MGDATDAVATYWRGTLAGSRQLVFVMDTERRIVAVSAGMAEALGGAPHDLIGRTCVSILHQGAVAPEHCPLHGLLLDEGQHDAEVHSDVLGKDLFVTATPLSHDSGRVTHVLHVAADITERKRIETALRESEAQLRESQRVARLGHYVYDIPSGMWTSSEALDEVFGIDAAYVRSVEGWLSVIHPDDRAAMATYLQEHVLRDRLPFDREYRVQRIVDGGVRWVHGRGTLEEGADGELSRMFGVIQDVTDERASRRALEKTTRLLEEAERLAHLGSWEWDMTTDVATYSKEWQRIYGVDTGEISQEDSLGLIHPSDRSKVVAESEKVRSSGLPYRAEYRVIRRSDGAERNVEVFGQPVRDEHGVVTRVWGASLDVTDRVAAQDALLESQQRLRRTLSATVAALATTIEMRDPYTAGHQHRVAELSAEIGQFLGWEDERVDDVRVAALLHDIGKVVVPVEILTKPGRLTDNEFALIRGHAAAAAEILAGIEWVGPVTQAVAQHHERLDGSGYPLGLKAEEIIPEARVLAVADVFEAMVSHRPYREGLPSEVAIAELSGGAGRALRRRGRHRVPAGHRRRVQVPRPAALAISSSPNAVGYQKASGSPTGSPSHWTTPHGSTRMPFRPVPQVAGPVEQLAVRLETAGDHLVGRVLARLSHHRRPPCERAGASTRQSPCVYRRAGAKFARVVCSFSSGSRLGDAAHHETLRVRLPDARPRLLVARHGRRPRRSRTPPRTPAGWRAGSFTRARAGECGSVLTIRCRYSSV